jgi:SAM-dependent methyltransferase
VSAPSTPDAYHLEELAIARRLGDARRVMPTVEPGQRRVLDVGCGAGQTLIASGCADGRLACGVDLDLHALRLGRQLSQAIRFVGARGEALPFRSGSFDLVICRVALPYMDVVSALAEFARVSRPGAALWLALHPVGMAVSDLLDHLRRLRLKAAAGRLLVIANTIRIHLGGGPFRSASGRRPAESCQTGRGITRDLSRAGYEQVELRRRDRFFIATARKAGRASEDGRPA